MMGLTLAIAAQTLLGADLSEVTADVGVALDLLMADFMYRFASPFPVPPWVPTL